MIFNLLKGNSWKFCLLLLSTKLNDVKMQNEGKTGMNEKNIKRNMIKFLDEIK